MKKNSYRIHFNQNITYMPSIYSIDIASFSIMIQCLREKIQNIHFTILK